MNITAFMNLMVILVPFLLITAVFSRLTILQLNLPGDAAPSVETEQTLVFEVIVRSDRIELADRVGGLIQAFPKGASGYDYKGLNEKLMDLKARYPQKTDATVLLEPDTAYDTVVQVMDAVRSQVVNRDTKPVQAELFPDISVGDAPAADA